MTDTTLRPMSTSQLLDRTFHLYRNNFLLFAGIAAFPPVLILVVQLMFTLLTHFSTNLSEGAGVAVACVTVITALVLVVAYMLGHYVASGATVYAVSQVHFGNPVTIGGSYTGIRSSAWRIIGASLLISLAVGMVAFVSYLVVIVPTIMATALTRAAGAGPAGAIAGCFIGLLFFAAGVAATLFVACKFSLAVPACVVEKLGVIECLQRSWFLSQRAVWRIVLIYVLAGFITVTLTFGLAFPNYISIFRGPPSLPLQMWGILASFLASTIAGPISAIAVALVYYDQRVRKEAFDLQLMMQSMGEPTVPPPIAPPPPTMPPVAPPPIGP